MIWMGFEPAVYWKDFEPAELLDNLRLVAYIPDLPFQQGKPLSLIEEEGVDDTALVDYNTTHESPSDRQIYVTITGTEDL